MHMSYTTYNSLNQRELRKVVNYNYFEYIYYIYRQMKIRKLQNKVWGAGNLTPARSGYGFFFTLRSQSREKISMGTSYLITKLDLNGKIIFCKQS
jgi:hypothetical protein